MHPMRRGITIAAASVLALSWNVLAGFPAAEAAETCHGKVATQFFNLHDKGEDDSSYMYGTKGDDVAVITGTSQMAWYWGKAGDDTICVRGRVDVLVQSGDGDDWISAEKDASGVGIFGDKGDDTIIGSAHYDALQGGAGTNLIKGLGGADYLTVAGVRDRAYGGPGKDTVIITPQAGPADSGSKLFGQSGDDDLEIWSDGAGAPDSTVRVRQQTVQGDGGPKHHFSGFQRYSLLGDVTFRGSDKKDRVTVASGRSSVRTYGGNDEVTSHGAGFAELKTGSGNDTIRISSGFHKTGPVELGRGDDLAILHTARGGSIRGGSGDDRFKLDIYYHDYDVDDEPPGRFSVYGASGKDTLSWDCKATVNLAKHRLKCATRSGRISFSGLQVYRGGKRNDTFRGSSRPDVFRGGAGKDTMYGKKGKDTLIGGPGVDTANGGPGKDVCHAEHKTKC